MPPPIGKGTGKRHSKGKGKAKAPAPSVKPDPSGSQGSASSAGPAPKRAAGRSKRDMLPACDALIDEFKYVCEDSSFFVGKDSRNQKRIVERLLKDSLAEVVKLSDEPDRQQALQLRAKALHCALETIKICKLPGFHSPDFIKATSKSRESGVGERIW